MMYLFFVVLFTVSCAVTEPVATEDKNSNRTVSEEHYKRAEALLSWNVSEKVLHNQIKPNWIDNERFWYQTRTKDGLRFFIVDPADSSRQKAFDHEHLAASLDSLFEQTVTASRLPFTTFSYMNNGTGIHFEAEKDIWDCDLVAYECSPSERHLPPEDSVVSPDGHYAAFIRSYNLWVMDLESGEEFALTTTGTERYGYATNSQGWFRSDRPVINWSPDSKKIATFRQDERSVQTMHLLETDEGRPLLHTWPYALPGDSNVPMLERVVLDVQERKKIWLDVEPSHQRTSNCCGLERDGAWTDLQWSDDGKTLAFVTTSRDYRQVDLYLADTRTGDVRHVFQETAKTFFESNLTSRGKPNWYVLFDRNQFIWFSRKDEWGHLYLHDLTDGQPINRITKGAWNLVDLLQVDTRSETIYFTAVGKNRENDPYQEYMYKVGFEGVLPNRIVLLTPEEGHHEISLSPSGNWIVDEYSSFSRPSVTVLRNRMGEKIMVLEKADATALSKKGWTAPESFVVKARDGHTDLYGIMIKPTDFDSSRSYPVVINIYPGPQVGSVGTRAFRASRRGEVHALAQLGFIVIQLDALGTPLRSKSFHTSWYGDMSDNGIRDQIAAVEQLSERYPWINREKTGIYGHSGGGYATMSALLDHPGVFSAGVASAGNMDNRGYTYYWGEKYQGPRKRENDFDSYRQQAIQEKADKLEDPLLLSYGTMDSNVHPNMTLVLVDALIEENKDFELLVFPNRGHGYANEPYHLRRTFDFFVRHLLEASPPADIRF